MRKLRKHCRMDITSLLTRQLWLFPFIKCSSLKSTAHIASCALTATTVDANQCMRLLLLSMSSELVKTCHNVTIFVIDNCQQRTYLPRALMCPTAPIHYTQTPHKDNPSDRRPLAREFCTCGDALIFCVRYSTDCVDKCVLVVSSSTTIHLGTQLLRLARIRPWHSSG